MAEEAEKRIFIICPIKEPGSETRRRSDHVKKYIIDPIAERHNYSTQRSDMISEPGRIDEQIIERLLDDNLVIADITDQNPNVFYELAVRHAIAKPVILMSTHGQSIPFDIRAQRVIWYNIHDLEKVEEAKEELSRQIETVEKDEFIVDSPILDTIAIQQLMSEEDDETPPKEILEILAIVRNLSEEVNRLISNQARLFPYDARERNINERRIERFFTRPSSDNTFSISDSEKIFNELVEIARKSSTDNEKEKKSDD